MNQKTYNIITGSVILALVIILAIVLTKKSKSDVPREKMDYSTEIAIFKKMQEKVANHEKTIHLLQLNEQQFRNEIQSIKQKSAKKKEAILNGDMDYLDNYFDSLLTN